MFLKILGLFLFCYLLGSLPFAYWVVRFIKKEDIRQLGSGNVGATNVLRTLGPVPAVAVFILDIFKGWLAVFLGKFFNPLLVSSAEYFWLVVGAGFLAMLGHIFPVWLGFKGGKGVATGLGFLMALNPLVFLITLVTAGLVIALSRYVSLGSLTGAVLVFLLMIYFKQPPAYILAAFLGAVFIFWKHRENIQRLLRGNEHRLGVKEKG